MVGVIVIYMEITEVLQRFYGGFKEIAGRWEVEKLERFNTKANASVAACTICGGHCAERAFSSHHAPGHEASGSSSMQGRVFVGAQGILTKMNQTSSMNQPYQT